MASNGTSFSGVGAAEQGETEAGTAELEDGIVAIRGTGIIFLQPYFLALLAGLHLKEGWTEKGLDLLTEALVLVDNTGERWYEAELYRRKGDLLLLRGGKMPEPSTLTRAHLR